MTPQSSVKFLSAIEAKKIRKFEGNNIITWQIYL